MKCRPSGRKYGQRWFDSPVAGSSLVTPVGRPPSLETRERPVPTVPDENRITLSRLQVPPNPLPRVFKSQSTVGGPPVIATFFSLPEAKNAMNRLSGDQNGKAPCSVPAIGAAP